MRLRGRAAPPELVPKEITRKNRGSAARLFSNSARIVRVSGSELPSSAMTISNRSRGRLELITDWRQFRNRDLPLNTGIPTVMSLADGWGRMAASRTSPIPEPPVSARSSRIESDFVRLLHSLPMCEMTGGQHRHDDAPCYRRPRSVGGFDREPDPCSTLKRIVGGRQMTNLHYDLLCDLRSQNRLTRSQEK